MTTLEEQPPPAPTSVSSASVRAAKRRRRLPTTLLALRVITTVHAIAIFAQPVFAGSYLTGNYDMLAGHATGADVVTSIGYLHLVVAILLWAFGGPRWPTIAVALLVAGETGQYFAGLAGALQLHVPLGVALLAGAVLITVTQWRPQDLTPRKKTR